VKAHIFDATTFLHEVVLGATSSFTPLVSVYRSKFSFHVILLHKMIPDS